MSNDEVCIELLRKLDEFKDKSDSTLLALSNLPLMEIGIDSLDAIDLLSEGTRMVRESGRKVNVRECIDRLGNVHDPKFTLHSMVKEILNG